MLIQSLLNGNIITNTAEILAQSTTGTPTSEHLPSSPGHPPEVPPWAPPQVAPLPCSSKPPLDVQVHACQM